VTTFNEIDTQVQVAFKRDDVDSTTRRFWINQAIKQLVSAYDIRESHDVYRAQLPSIGMYYGTLPNDIKTADRMILEYSSTEHKDMGPPIKADEFHERYPDIANQSTNYPRIWAIDGDKFWLYPPTDDTYWVRLILTHFFATLDNGDSLPADYLEDLIIARSLALLFALRGESAEQRMLWESEFARLESQFFGGRNPRAAFTRSR